MIQALGFTTAGISALLAIVVAAVGARVCAVLIAAAYRHERDSNRRHGRSYKREDVFHNDGTLEALHEGG